MRLPGARSHGPVDLSHVVAGAIRTELRQLCPVALQGRAVVAREYAVKVVGATRDPASVGQQEVADYVTYGASPRAAINMILAAKALAFVRGRDYALPEDVRALALDVLRHRLVLSYEALADNVTPDAIINRILAAVPLPEVPLHEHRSRPDDAVSRLRHDA